MCFSGYCVWNLLGCGDHETVSEDTDGTPSDTPIVVLELPPGYRSEPSVEILKPCAGNKYLPGELVAFEAVANDPEDGALLNNSVVWMSDVEERLGTGTDFSKELQEKGIHTITAIATDADRHEAVQSIEVEVVDSTEFLWVDMRTPCDGDVYVEGEVSSYQALALDPEDGRLSHSSVVWTSDIEGRIGAGAVLGERLWEQGVHEITVTVTDSDGNQATDQATVTVVP